MYFEDRIAVQNDFLFEYEGRKTRGGVHKHTNLFNSLIHFHDFYGVYGGITTLNSCIELQTGVREEIPDPP